MYNSFSILTTIKKLFWVSRPISWLNTAYPFVAGYILSGGRDWTVIIIGTLFFLVPYNLLLYGVNDVFDYESDILNPRKGGIEGMREERAFHSTILVGSVVTSIPFLAYLTLVSLHSKGHGTALAVLVAVMFMVVAYSLKYLRFKEIPIVDSITSSSHFAGPLMFALALTSSLGDGWPYITAFFLWGMASHAFGAVQDIIPDRQGKLASIATVLGATTTVRLSILLYLAAVVITCLQGGTTIFVGISGLLYVANIISYRSVNDEDSARTNAGWKRFIWLNYFVGFVVTMVLIVNQLHR